MIPPFGFVMLGLNMGSKPLEHFLSIWCHNCFLHATAKHSLEFSKTIGDGSCTNFLTTNRLFGTLAIIPTYIDPNYHTSTEFISNGSWKIDKLV